MIPNPSRSYYRTEPLYFYFEAYRFGDGSDAPEEYNISYRIDSRSSTMAPSEFDETFTAGPGNWAHTAKLDISKLHFCRYFWVAK